MNEDKRFREVARVKQALSKEECINILIKEPRGVLSVIGDDGYPYGMPIDHWYDEESGKLYFHTGKKGHRTDALAKCSKVSYCVLDEGTRKEGDWYLVFKSVIAFGTMSLVENHDEAIEITRKLSYKYTKDSEYIEKEIVNSGRNVMVWEMNIEHITGKTVNEK